MASVINSVINRRVLTTFIASSLILLERYDESDEWLNYDVLRLMFREESQLTHLSPKVGGGIIGSRKLGNVKQLPSSTVPSPQSPTPLSRYLRLTTFADCDSPPDPSSSTNASINASTSSLPPTDDYPYFSPWHRSLMRKHLTRSIYTSLKDLSTPNSYTLNDVIKSGTACGYSLPRNMGCMAGDYESYGLFKTFFDPIIREYHDFSPNSRHITDIDPEHLKHVEVRWEAGDVEVTQQRKHTN